MQQILNTKGSFQDKIPYDIQMGYVHCRPKRVAGVPHMYKANFIFIFLYEPNHCVIVLHKKYFSPKHYNIFNNVRFIYHSN